MSEDDPVNKSDLSVNTQGNEMPDIHPTPELNSQYLSLMRNTEPGWF